jgi:hypothetical protein
MSKRKIESVDISAANSIILPPDEELKINAEKEKVANITRQEEVEKYNEAIHTLDEKFKTKQFVGTEIIVRLKLDDYLTKGNASELENGIKKVNKVAMQKSSGDWTTIDNPLPYLFAGVICAVPKIAVDQFKENYGIALVPGVEVEIKDIDLPSSRYYLDKAKMDIKGTEEAMLRGEKMFPNHEGYFKISVYDIESFV